MFWNRFKINKASGKGWEKDFCQNVPSNVLTIQSYLLIYAYLKKEFKSLKKIKGEFYPGSSALVNNGSTPRPGFPFGTPWGFWKPSWCVFAVFSKYNDNVLYYSTALLHLS